MFSLPVSSGWIPLRISISEPTRPRVPTEPDQGSVIREISLSVVDFPLPFGPMMPTASPSCTWSETSASAQMLPTRSSSGVRLRPARSRASPTSVASRRSRVTRGRFSPSRYRFHTCSSLTTGDPLDDIGERPIDPLVPPVREEEPHGSDDGGAHQRPPLGPLAVGENAPETVHDRRER